MNVRPFRHILINNDTSVTKTLEASPMDWADLTINHFRHELYESVLFEETLNQRFPKVGNQSDDKGAYWFLIDAYDTNGVKADVTYKRQELNSQTNEYDDDFTGKVDFSADSGWSIEDEFIDVKIIDSRKLAKFLSRDEIDVNIFNLISLDNITVADFSNPYLEANYPPVDILLQCNSIGSFNSAPATNPVYNGELIINEVGDRILIQSPGVDIRMYENTLDYSTDLIKISAYGGYLIAFTATGGSWSFDVSMSFAVYNESDVLQSNLEIIIASLSGTGATSDFAAGTYDFSDYDLLSSVPANGYVTYTLTENKTSTITLGETTVSVDDLNFYEKTDGEPENKIRGLYAHEVASRFIQLYTSETDTAKLIYSPILGKSDSDFITYPSTGYFGRAFTTSGYHLRQFVDRAINFNFRNWFKSLKADKAVGLWFNKTSDYFEISELEDFYKAEVSSVSLGEVKDLTTTPYSKIYFNSILSGEPKIETEDFQGVNEIHTETEHTISIETKNKYDGRSSYSRATIWKELSRRKNIRSYASEDTKWDNLIAIDELDNTDTVIQGDLANASGIINIEQYYNLTKTPRQNLMRQQVIINAPLFKDVSEEQKFLKSVKDTNISYTDPTEGTIVNEFDDIPQLFEPLFYPETYEFEATYTKDIRDEIRDNPHAIYYFTDKDGDTLYGYIKNIEGKLYKGIGQYTLTRANPNRIP